MYAEKWTIKAQERLSEFNKWKDICNVEYTNDRVLHSPYITEPTVQTTARGTAYTHQAVTLTDDSVTISDIAILPQQIDRADLAQQTFIKQMDLADKQAILINETIETAMYTAGLGATNFGDTGGGALGLGATSFTLTINNLDDLVTGVQREIRVANGQSKLDQHGMFMVLSPAGFQLVQQFAMANGYTTADKVLSDGIKQGFEYMGCTFYSSNKLTAGHFFAGVKKQLHLGIVKDTYGQVVIDEEPATSSGALSAIAVVMRADYKFKIWTNVLPVLFDVNATV